MKMQTLGFFGPIVIGLLLVSFLGGCSSKETPSPSLSPYLTPTPTFTPPIVDTTTSPTHRSGNRLPG